MKKVVKSKAKKTEKTGKKKKDRGIITKNMLISEVIEKYPKTIPVLINSGLHCIGCNISAFETLEQGLKVHGYSKKKIYNIVKKLNSILKRKN